MPELDDLSILDQKPFSRALWKLDNFIAQGRYAFLIGAGCSKCAGLPLVEDLMDKVVEGEILDGTSKEIIENIKCQFDEANASNIEDYLSELIDLLAIAERRDEAGCQAVEIPIPGCDKTYYIEDLQKASTQIKKAISSAIAITEDIDISTHQAFVRAVHMPVRAGRLASNKNVNYIVLNYDTVLETALAIEKIPYSDGIDGGTTGWWNPETFNDDNVKANVLKLHGSMDWIEFPGDPLPRRIAHKLRVQDASDSSIMIWPASTKYRETQLDPFAQLKDRARDVLHPPADSQLVLVICGYSFGDTHINLEIEKALRESTGKLTLVVFSSDSHLSGKLYDWNHDPRINNQVLIFAKGGFFHGKIQEQSNKDLPWWKFENFVRLLGGER